MKPLLVGEGNPYSSNPRHALLPWPEGASGNRLMLILGLTRHEYLRRFDRVNLCPGSTWVPPLARARAIQIINSPYEHIILLGKKVAKSFRLDSAASFCHALNRFYLLPHPSGRNLVWNDPASEQRARELLREFLK